MTAAEEFAVKLERVRAIMDERSLTAVVIRRTVNLAWLLGGAECWVGRTVESGSCTAIVTAQDCHIAMNTIEAPRLATEELSGLQVTLHRLPWYDDRTAELIVALGGSHLGSDSDGGEAAPVAGALTRAQCPLTPPEIERYRALGQDAGEALGEAMRRVEPGMTEHQIAGIIAHEIAARGAQTAVLLVGADDRAMRFRHPVPTGRTVVHYAMGAVVARRGGLHASLTRCVHFGALPDELATKHRLVCQVDGALLGATQEGATAGSVLEIAQKAYAAAGYPEEWRYHHQGGATGYQSRTWRATPGSKEPIQSGQAFAWNPSLQGTKSEDTIICHGRGVEVLTTTPGWPTVVVPSAGGMLERPAILTA